MGAVFEAVHEDIARHVAIKVLHPEYSVRPDTLKRFFNEARAVNLIDHPGLVQISDYGQTADRTAYIVMELLRGESLSKRLKQRGAMSMADALPIASQIASALTAAHSKRIVHRDLKPENVMLIPDLDQPGRERTKLLDFGIAKLAKGTQSGSDRTQTNMLMGTPAYMSPEQCQGAGRVDDRSDVYSFGVMLYEMLAGRRPFITEGTGALIIKHVKDPPPPLRELAPHVSEPVAALVHLLLAKEKELRPPMHEVLAELRRLLGDASTSQGSVPHPSWLATALGALRLRSGLHSTLGHSTGEFDEGPSRRRWMPRVAVLALLVGLGGGSLYLFSLRRSPSIANSTRSTADRQTADSTQSADELTGAAGSPSLVAPLPPPTIEWRISSDPPGAEVLRKDTGQIYGTTPLSLRRPVRPDSIILLLRHAGYQPMEVTIAGDANSNIERRLLSLPGKPPAPVLGQVRKPLVPLSPTANQPLRAPVKNNARSNKNAQPRRDLLEN